MKWEARLIKCKIELDKVALREPMTVQQVKVRMLWERVSNILRRRYNRWE